MKRYALILLTAIYFANVFSQEYEITVCEADLPIHLNGYVINSYPIKDDSDILDLEEAVIEDLEVGTTNDDGFLIMLQ